MDSDGERSNELLGELAGNNDIALILPDEHGGLSMMHPAGVDLGRMADPLPPPPATRSPAFMVVALQEMTAPTPARAVLDLLAQLPRYYEGLALSLDGPDGE